MSSVVKRVCNIIDKLYLGIGMLLLIIIVVSLTLQVITRYVMNSSMIGTEELARYCFIWMSMLGASVAVGTSSHASVSMLEDNLKGRIKYYFKITIQVMIIIASLILLYEGIKMAISTGVQKSPTLRIPMMFIYAAIPVGSIGMALHGLNNFINLCLDLKEVE